MDITSESILLKGLSTGNLVEYLKLSGWQHKTTPKWNVLYGPSDADNDMLEVVLPQNTAVSDLKVYLASAVNQLSALRDEDAQTIIQRINYYDSDVFTIYNKDYQSENSLALSRASTQILSLKGLVGYGAMAERNLRPFYSNLSAATANRMIKHFRFEHTVRGSFGFTITSQIVGSVEKAEYIQSLLPGLATPPNPIEIAPEERRIMERIVRGLLITEQATQQMDPNLLVREYASGFNANMCRKAARLQQDHFGPIECHVLWSPKLAPSEDVATVERTEINNRSRTYLNEAAESLRDFRPAPTMVLGNVVGLISRGNPFGDEATDRSVVVRWTNREEGLRPVDVIVPLDRSAYAIALEAHQTWTPVQVTGVIVKVGNEWRMTEVRGFGTISSSQ